MLGGYQQQFMTMMDMPFVRLFLLPREMAPNTVLAMLALKDISKLERAVNNKHSYEVFRSWLCCISLPYTIGSVKMNQHFLKWMADRKIKIQFLELSEGFDETSLQKFAAHKLEVSEFRQLWCHNINEETRIPFLKGLMGLRAITLHSPGQAGYSAMWNSVFEAHPRLINFSILYSNSSCRQLEDTSQLLSAIAYHCKNIQTVYLNCSTNIDDTSIVLLAQQCLQLETLHLNVCLELTDISLQALGQHCVQLRVLRLRSASRGGHVSDAGLVNLLQRCRQLTALHLWDCTGVTVRSFTALVPLCEQITDLSLCKCAAFHSPEAEFAMKQLRRLTHLALPNCTNISEALLIALILNNANLRNITLSGIDTVTDAVLAVIGQSCAQLRWLVVSCCPRVTSLSTLRDCSQLAALHIRECTGITDTALLRLATTQGPKIFVAARGSGITEAALAQLQGSKRIALNMCSPIEGNA